MTKKVRQTATKHRIKQAIAKLLAQKCFEKISITEICDTAEINRGTFYLHYKDKYDMIQKIKEDFQSELYSILTQESRPFSREALTESLEFIRNDMTFFKTLAKTPYVNLSQTIRDYIIFVLDNVPDFDSHLSEHTGVPAKFAKTAFVASIEAVMSEWILSGGQETSEEMTEILKKMSY